jgi:xanthine dehydrogenase accessory factor
VPKVRFGRETMKRWKETADLLSRAIRLAESGHGTAVATVVGIDGSAYRRPGAKFLVQSNGETAGSISGGCLEADVREIALQIIAGAPARLLRYETGADDASPFGLGLGCSGAVEIFVQPLVSAESLETARVTRELLTGEAAFALATFLGGASVGRTLVVTPEGLRAGSTNDAALDRATASRTSELLSRGESGRSGGEAEIFTEVLVPPPHLMIFGAGDDAIPLCAYASDVGFRVTLVDHREAALAAERFPGAYRRVLLRPEAGMDCLPIGPRTLAVVKTHSFAHDREWARRLILSGVEYIGLLGPRARSKEILRQIGEGAENGAIDDGRVFAPVGLDIGAEGPEQIALAIVAELLSVSSSRGSASLREKKGAVHAR